MPRPAHDCKLKSSKRSKSQRFRAPGAALFRQRWFPYSVLSTVRHFDSSTLSIMRKKFIAGNWKMNLDRAAAVKLAEAVVKRAGDFPNVDIALCPPFVYLEAVAKVVSGTQIALGA